MILIANSYIDRGLFEIYYGPMKSGKSKALIDRLDRISYIKGINSIIFKPDTDIRNGSELFSRSSNRKFPCEFIKAINPYDILSYNGLNNYDVIAIDEAQFFSEGIDDVVEELCRQDKHIIVGGLNLDFRGEPFGQMGVLISKADKTYPLTAICEYHNCGRPSTRTQRLIDGNPADYNSPIILIEGKSKETYETRCLTHHIVPNKLDKRKGHYTMDLEDRTCD